MKRIHCHYSGNINQGWAFDVEDDSPLSDKTPLSAVIKSWVAHSGKIDHYSPLKAIHAGRTLHAIGPWYVCQDCGQVMLEYWNKPSRAVGGRLYCSPCATKAAINQAREDVQQIVEKKRKGAQMTLVK